MKRFVDSHLAGLQEVSFTFVR